MLASSKICLLWLVAELHKHFGVSSVVLREENPVPQRFLLNWNQAKLLFLGRTLLSNSRCEMQRVYYLWQPQKQESFISWLGFIWIISGQTSSSKGQRRGLIPYPYTFCHHRRHNDSLHITVQQKISSKNPSESKTCPQSISVLMTRICLDKFSIIKKNCLIEPRQQSCCVFHHLRCSPSGKHICWDKGIILSCWCLPTKTYVKFFHQNRSGELGFWLNRKKAQFSTRRKTTQTKQPQKENLSRALLLQCFKI